jgi:hypothetical protein
MFPYFLVKSELDSLTTILVKTLEVTPIDIDSLAINTTERKVALNLRGNIVTLDYTLSLFLPIFQIIVQIRS